VTADDELGAASVGPLFIRFRSGQLRLSRRPKYGYANGTTQDENR
jgi:hypothetical protein